MLYVRVRRTEFLFELGTIFHLEDHCIRGGGSGLGKYRRSAGQ
jgi:hypothetical protein